MIFFIIFLTVFALLILHRIASLAFKFFLFDYGYFEIHPNCSVTLYVKTSIHVFHKLLTFLLKVCEFWKCFEVTNINDSLHCFLYSSYFSSLFIVQLSTFLYLLLNRLIYLQPIPSHCRVSSSLFFNYSYFCHTY